MRAVAYAGYRFADLNIGANFPPNLQQGPSRSPSALVRANTSPLAGPIRQDTRQITMECIVKPGYDVEVTLLKLLGAIDPTNATERTLVVALNSGTEVEALAQVGQWREGSTNNVFIDFYLAEPTFRERSDTSVTLQSFTAARTIPLYNTGGATVPPVVKLGYSVQRATESASVGWKYRRTITVSNTGTTNWNRVRLTFDLGDTSAWVSGGKAQSDGDDVRVWLEGNELTRTLTNFGSERGWCHVFASIPADSSATFEIVYGNPDATTATNLSTRTDTGDTYAADDLQGDYGTLTAGGTTTATDSGATWETDEWAYGFIGFTSGTGSVRYRRVLSNTATVITLNRALGSSVAAGTKYVLWKSGNYIEGGRVTGGISSTGIQDTAHSNKWGANALIDATVTFTGGTASPATMTVASNTTDTLSFTSSFSVNPSVNESFTIQRYGFLSWNVNRAVYERDHRGLWRINRYHSKGVRVSFGDETPGGWVPWLMLDNQDDFAQGRYVDEGSGGGHSINNWPYLYARRSVRSQNTWPEEGIADGVCFFDPRGMLGFDWGYQMKNENGIGEVVVLSQQPGGEDWQTQDSDSTTRASLTDVSSSGAGGHQDLTGDDNPVRIYTGVQPADGVEVPSTEKKSRSIELRNHLRCLVWLAQDDLGGLSSSLWTVGAEAAMYHINAEVRLGGGTTSDPPYDLITCGPRFGLASGQRLWVNGSPTPGAPLLGLYDSSDLLVSRVPWAAIVEHHEEDVDGTDTAIVADALMPLPPHYNLIANEDNITNWTLTNSAGVTASISNTATTVYDGGATTILVTVTTTPVGAWTITLAYPRLTVIPGTAYEFGVAYRRTTLTSAVLAQMKVAWSYSSGTPSVVDSTDTIGGATSASVTWFTDGGGRTIFAGSSTNSATTEATVSLVVSGTGSTSGAFRFDQVVLVPAALNAYISEDEQGTLTAETSYRKAYHG